MKTQLFFICLIFFVSSFSGCQAEQGKVENMMSFAKAYGYVKYFHPSDKSELIDWEKFSAYGAQKIEKCKTKKQVVKSLNELFKPFAPSVKFTLSDTIPAYDLERITPDNRTELRKTYWQHNGLSTGMTNKEHQVYESRLVGSKKQNQLFDYEPEFGTVITKEIGDGIYCQIPLVLYSDNQTTYPVCDAVLFNDFKLQIEALDYNKDQLLFRLGNIVNVYNVFQHFYPYFDVVDVNWESEFKKAIKQCYLDESALDHLVTLEKFTATLHDGHISIYNRALRHYYSPPIAWEWIENKLVITQVYTEQDSIKIGDIVTQIENRKPEEYFKDIYARISAGTKGYLDYNANVKSLLGLKGSFIDITINDLTMVLERNVNPYKEAKKEKNKRGKYKKMKRGVWYLDLDQIEMETIDSLLPKLVKSKSIICDLRGYPNGNHGFINHLLAIDDTTKAWMQIPQIVYPDQKNIIDYQNHDWIEMMKTAKPYLGDKNIIFIINGEAISYAESYMGFIEGYNLATIIGQPTAGTNGNVNPFSLLGGYNISWTGMKVLKHDGSQHHGIGILPDIYIEKTIQGIKDGRDEFLEKAMEIVKNKR